MFRRYIGDRAFYRRVLGLSILPLYIVCRGMDPQFNAVTAIFR